jgi:hypothetical protein
MNQSVPLFPLLSAAVGIFLAWLVGRTIYQWVEAVRLSNKQASEAAVKLSTDVAKLDVTLIVATDTLTRATEATNKMRELLLPVAEEFRKNMAGVPQLLEGVTKIGSAQLAIMQAQRADQAERLKNPYGRPNGNPPQRNTAEMNRAHEVDELIRSGMTREEAELVVNPANAETVWGGLDSWRNR